MKTIIAVNKVEYIGKDDKLPWNCKEDLKHFKNLTMGFDILPRLKSGAFLRIYCNFILIYTFN